MCSIYSDISSRTSRERLESNLINLNVWSKSYAYFYRVNCINVISQRRQGIENKFRDLSICKSLEKIER